MGPREVVSRIAAVVQRKAWLYVALIAVGFGAMFAIASPTGAQIPDEENGPTQTPIPPTPTATSTVATPTATATTETVVTSTSTPTATATTETVVTSTSTPQPTATTAPTAVPSATPGGLQGGGDLPQTTTGDVTTSQTTSLQSAPSAQITPPNTGDAGLIRRSDAGGPLLVPGLVLAAGGFGALLGWSYRWSCRA